jgi:hypothetical protein
MGQEMKDLRTKWQAASPTPSNLVLAEPPEAGWLLPTRSNAEATAEAEMLAVPGASLPQSADEDRHRSAAADLISTFGDLPRHVGYRGSEEP